MALTYACLQRVELDRCHTVWTATIVLMIDALTLYAVIYTGHLRQIKNAQNVRRRTTSGRLNTSQRCHMMKRRMKYRPIAADTGLT